MSSQAILISRICDSLTFLSMFISLAFAYRFKFKFRTGIILLIGCTAAGVGCVILNEQLFRGSFMVYIVNYLIWGAVFSLVALRGRFELKLVMCAVFICSFFWILNLVKNITDLIAPSQTNTRIICQCFVIVSSIFICTQALNTKHPVPPMYWFSLFLVVLCEIALFVMRDIIQFNESVPNIVVSVCMLVILNATFMLSNQLIRSHLKNIMDLSIKKLSSADALTALEAERLNKEILHARHEEKHHLATLAALLESGKFEDARKMIDDLYQTPSTGANDINSGNAFADAILAQRRTLAQSKDIQIAIDACLDSNLPYKESDFSSILTNLLDNAIEGCENLKDPWINVRIYPAKSYLCIVVENSADTDAIQANPSLETRKPDPALHGMGIEIIQETVKKYSGITRFYATQDGVFHAHVMLRL